MQTGLNRLIKEKKLYSSPKALQLRREC